ncbi:MAG: pyridoxamine 5'-phosphate oxidase family protein [Chloroflexia bacterium]
MPPISRRIARFRLFVCELKQRLGRAQTIDAVRRGTSVSRFTPEEIAHLQSQRLGRLATIGANGDLHVVPVGFRYNPEHDTIDIGGQATSRRPRSIATRCATAWLSWWTMSCRRGSRASSRCEGGKSGGSRWHQHRVELRARDPPDHSHLHRVHRCE